MESIETVRVIRPECPGGYCIINKSDLKDGDEIYGDKEAEGDKARTPRAGRKG